MKKLKSISPLLSVIIGWYSGVSISYGIKNHTYFHPILGGLLFFIWIGVLIYIHKKTNKK